MKILYFGEIAEKTGKNTENLDVNNTTDLLAHLKAAYSIEASGIRLAVNHNIVNSNERQPISETDEVAVLSPFAGG